MKSNSGSFKKGDNSVDLKVRFWKNVDKFNLGGCWNWMGYKDPNGYGKISVDRTAKLAHRVSYELTQGNLDKKLLLCHKCDNPSCVNPDHLFVGTHKDNSQDMIRKNRGCSGENAPYAKLTKKDVEEIREQYNLGKISMRKLGKKFNVSYGAINAIIYHRTWK